MAYKNKAEQATKQVGICVKNNNNENKKQKRKEKLGKQAEGDCLSVWLTAWLTGWLAGVRGVWVMCYLAGSMWLQVDGEGMRAVLGEPTEAGDWRNWDNRSERIH